MDLMPASPARLLGALLGAAALAVGLQAHEGVQAGNNLYRYDVARSGASPACEFDYVELGSSARTLPLPPRGGAEPDDGAAVLALQRPFELYQVPHRALVVSANGYLAAADSLDGDDGSDFGNDCPLPKRADNAVAVQERIYVYHDDLRARREGGQVRHAFFPECPRAGAGGRAEPCTVVEWNGFERSGPLLSTQPLRAQAVLYHDTRQVALQYAAIDDSRAASATIGLQGFDGRAASQAGCNAADTVRPRQAVCFFDPRHPPRR
jgi:hypothetical protein